MAHSETMKRIMNQEQSYLYNKYLKELLNINFTMREIDIIACIINKRNIKKIAQVLSISHKTVNTHIYNIMNKIGCNNKDAIIDFVQQARQVKNINHYYLHLLIQHDFENQLIKIGRVINQKTIQCILMNEKNISSYNEIFQNLSKIFAFANISLLSHTTLSDDIKKIDLCIIMNDDDKYITILNIIKNIANNVAINQLINEFKDKRYSMEQSLEGMNLDSISVNDFVNIEIKKPSRYTLTFFLVIFLISVLILVTIQNNESRDIKAINMKYNEFVTNFTDDNSYSIKMQQNYKLIKEAEENLLKIQHKKVRAYFYSTKLSSEELINFLYTIHALSTYYHVHEYNTSKAYEVLSLAKNIAENYIQKHSIVAIDFTSLNKEELYMELCITKDLPEMYTKLLYSLGKIYIYKSNNHKKAMRYFKLSKYLGKRLEIFEGHLSVKRGYNQVYNANIKEKIANHDYESAIKQIKFAIQSMLAIREDNIEYRRNYRPNNANPNLIIPNIDTHNQVFCDKQIAKYFLQLMLLSKDKAKKLKYAQLTMIRFIGYRNLPGILRTSKPIAYHNIADNRNLLGLILLKLYDNNIDLQVYKDQIHQILGYYDPKKDDLEYIKHIFNVARYETRSNDYEKADSIDGLIMVYNRLLDTGKYSITKEERIRNKIDKLIIKRDVINNQLNRIARSEDFQLNIFL